MATRTITDLLLDTSYLKGVGSPFSPDFQKLVALSQAKTIRIVVPHIAWEERRTQLVDEALEPVRKARHAFAAVSAKHSRSSILSGLTAPVQVLWRDEDIYEKSKEAMKAFAEEYKIEVMELGADHAVRAWERYFSVGEPFNASEERVQRRKAIPDSWIFEAAIDLKRAYPNLRAVCGDKALANALAANGIPVYLVTQDKTAAQLTQEILDAIRGELEPEAHEGPKRAAEAKPEPERAAKDEVRIALAHSQSQFRNLEEKILGYVGYLGEVTKDQLFDLLVRTGVSLDMARNAAERLSMTKMLVDTGNHYLPGDKDAGERAARMIEAEIVELLKQTG